jgi:hypothetical protein
MRIDRCSIAIVTIAAAALMSGDFANAQSSGSMTARLVDPEKKAAKREATVEVTASGVQLVDPASASEMPMAGQAHLHYQVDNGPIIATPSAKLSFHELRPGSHTIVVTLVGNDHKPIGPQQTLTFAVPGLARKAASAEKPSTPSADKPTPSTKTPPASSTKPPAKY